MAVLRRIRGLPPAPAAARPVGGTQKIKGMVFRETSQRKKTVMSPSKVPDRITCLALKLVTPLRYKRLSPDFMYKRRPKAQQRPEQSQKGMASAEGIGIHLRRSLRSWGTGSMGKDLSSDPQ